MKLTKFEEYEAELRTKQLREFKKENKDYEKNLYKNDKFGLKVKHNPANLIFSALFAFLMVCSVGMVFARIVGFSHTGYQTSLSFNGDRYGNR